jgi:hypothetical protein
MDGRSELTFPRLELWCKERVDVWGPAFGRERGKVFRRILKWERDEKLAWQPTQSAMR